LGLMYDEITLLKNRTIAYEETIELEKAKLRQSIEDICHQLKTPLTSVSIYTELLLGKDNENEYLMNIDQQVQKINYLIQGLLKLAKLQSHQVKFGFEDLSINQVMQMAIESLQSICQDTQITIQQTDLHFYYDESWLQEALSNIIKNSLEENCQHISISFEEHQQYIKVFICNDGKEIDGKDLPHIFERFYHTSKQQGVGIGLALAKEIIERHHGSINAYNQNGVIFELTFPKYQVSQKYKVS
ncbi:MAG: HAMP domain-containing sensor histidine kinase, partial [Coprobacillus sp.]